MILYRLYSQISCTDKFVLKVAEVRRMASVYRCVARIIARSRKRGEGEIRYGRKERGAERRRKIGRPVDWAGREERREEAKKKKMKKEVRKEVAR